MYCLTQDKVYIIFTNLSIENAKKIKKFFKVTIAFFSGILYKNSCTKFIKFLY